MEFEVPRLQVLKNLCRVIPVRYSLQPCHVLCTVPSYDRLITAAVWHIVVIVIDSKLLSHSLGHLNIVLSSLHHRCVVASLVPSHVHQDVEKRPIFRVETKGITAILLHGFQRRLGERLESNVDGDGGESRCDLEEVVGHLLDELGAHLERCRPHGSAKSRWHIVTSVRRQILERAVAGVILHEWNAEVLFRDFGRVCEIDWNEVFQFGESELIGVVRRERNDVCKLCIFLSIVDGVLESGDQCWRGTCVMNAHAAPHGRLYNGFIVERRDDTEVVAATTQGPVQIGENFRGCVDDNSRRSDDFIRSDIIASKTVFIREVADASTEGKTANANMCCLRHVSACPEVHFADRAS
jgi:hypothetical protein